MRRAAEQAREYYATDPEAREWAEFAGVTADYGEAVSHPSDTVTAVEPEAIVEAVGIVIEHP